MSTTDKGCNVRTARHVPLRAQLKVLTLATLGPLWWQWGGGVQDSGHGTVKSESGPLITAGTGEWLRGE